MDLQILIANITNPSFLFFVLGIIAVSVKSDLEIPANSSKFISLYLLFSIGFKGGQELTHSTFNSDILLSLVFGLFIAALIPIYTFYIAKRKLNISDSGAIAASFGSVSAVTFLSAVAFLECQKVLFGGHMIAVMTFMEAPAIIVGVILINIYDKESTNTSIGSIIKHSFTNSSVLLILGSLLIGYFADSKQAEGIKPFTTDIFKGFLSIFLLEMGMITARRFKAFKQYGWFAFSMAVIIPCINGCLVAYFSQFITPDIGNRFIFAILAASASYIAVPAAMQIAVPKADPGLYIPMALGITFPFNLTLGIPLYYFIIQHT